MQLRMFKKNENNVENHESKNKPDNETTLQKSSHSIIRDIILGLSSALAALPIEILLCVIEKELVSHLKLSNTLLQNTERRQREITTYIHNNPQSLLFAVIIEEIIFRGAIRPALQILLEKAIGNNTIAKYGSSIISSGLFAACHDYGVMSPILLSGITYDYLKDKTGGLLAPITAHFSHNAITYITERYSSDRAIKL